MKQIKIDTEFVKLSQALKIADMVNSGGEAKVLILEGKVKVNGEVEIQRGKKIRNGDIIEVENEKFEVIA